MGESSVPKILYDLLNRAEKLDDLAPDTVWEYLELLNEDESFLPEVVAIVGPATFTLLVQHMGGQSVRVPKPEDIIRKVKRARKIEAALAAECAVPELSDD